MADLELLSYNILNNEMTDYFLLYNRSLMIGFGESGVLGYFGGQALLYSKYNYN